MCGWFSAAIARASRVKRSACSALSRLMATMRSTRVSRAFQTSPMPPAPTGATNTYGPRDVPGAQGIIASILAETPVGLASLASLARTGFAFQRHAETHTAASCNASILLNAMFLAAFRVARRRIDDDDQGR